MADTIQILGDFDGGNPKDPDSIIQSKPNAVIIKPHSEDNDPNYKFRLDIKVLNNTSKLQRLDLTIDWQEPNFNYLRNYIYAKYEKDPDWTYLPMEVLHLQTHGIVDIKPGETDLCMNPRYNYEDYLNFIHRIPENKYISKDIIGSTPEGRKLWMIKVGNNSDRAPKRIMIVSRIHPYETSGSFCVEAIVDSFLQSESDARLDLLNNKQLYLIPMANPDGVYKGLCKLTASDGFDLSKDADRNDPISGILIRNIDKNPPHIYCELHNWMFPEFDGIYFLNWLQAKRLIQNIPSQKPFNKNWKIHLKKKFFSTPHFGLKKYCHEKFNAVSFVIEYPWYSRTVKDMKRLGVDTLVALTRL